jgi:hypothetical protein
MAIAKTFYGNDYSKVFCLNNAIQFSQTDGITLCLVQGIHIYIYVYVYMFNDISLYRYINMSYKCTTFLLVFYLNNAIQFRQTTHSVTLCFVQGMMYSCINMFIYIYIYIYILYIHTFFDTISWPRFSVYMHDTKYRFISQMMPIFTYIY